MIFAIIAVYLLLHGLDCSDSTMLIASGMFAVGSGLTFISYKLQKLNDKDEE